MIGIPSLEADPPASPRNEEGKRCPWPYDPLFLVGAPIGMYHCGYCGAMVIAGVPHPDYPPDDDPFWLESLREADHG